MFFSDKSVETRLRLEQRGIERSLGPIVRMQMKIDIALRRERVSRIEDGRKSETAQARGNQRRRGSLAASDEKVAPALIYWIKID
jgi:hypothetical protein